MATKTKVKNPLELLKDFGEPPAHLLIISPDDIRLERALNHFLENTCSLDPKKLGNAVSRYRATDLSTADLNKLKDQLRSLSLFNQLQVHIVLQLDQVTAAAAKEIMDACKNAGPGVCVIYCAKSLPSNSTIRKTFATKNLLIEFNQLKGFEINRWIQKELRARGVTNFTDQVVATLAQLGHEHLDQIDRFLEHAVLYSDGDTITSQDLQQLFTHHIEPSEFEFIEALEQQNPAKAELLASQLILGGKNLFGLLALISRIFSNYLQIKFMATQGRSVNEIRESLGMNPWVFNKSLVSAKKYNMEQLREIQKVLISTDSKLKNRSLGAESLLSDLIRNLSAC
ncbi:MAG: DNA polymerase III subunit delta [Bdellovibrionales bacterium]|nr:DNA polymerase III subunit delta [Bdellovibrionales bacterium]